MMKIILTIREEDLDFILKQCLVNEVKEIKIKRKAKQRKVRILPINTYNEPDE
ncbi:MULTISPECIES: hypothetical protein [Chryseobacterium]|uniref:hypothetical protein n=1 Tax=Chryseobacterium TaxID=59732 RepID=UPI0012DFFE58|nr:MULTISPECIES: hypothetical protein [Chryseobacterium]MBO9692661.1 hypothetical protein [Chryseobacterium sp.]